MTPEQMKQLNLNLTRSDSKAKPGYIRGKHGLLPEDQSFMPLDLVPLFTYKQNKQVNVSEFLQDYIKQEEKLAQLQARVIQLEQLLDRQNKQTIERMKQLEDRLIQLETIQTENDNFVLE